MTFFSSQPFLVSPDFFFSLRNLDLVRKTSFTDILSQYKSNSDKAPAKVPPLRGNLGGSGVLSPEGGASVPVSSVRHHCAPQPPRTRARTPASVFAQLSDGHL